MCSHRPTHRTPRYTEAQRFAADKQKDTPTCRATQTETYQTLLECVPGHALEHSHVDGPHDARRCTSSAPVWKYFPQ